MNRIFKTVNDTPGKKGTFAGFHITDPQMEVDINLIAISSGVSKSSAIRDIISKWLIDQDVAYNVAKQAFAIWWFEGKRNISLQNFKKKIREELTQREIPDEQINEIITNFDDEIKRSDQQESKKNEKN